MTIGHAAIYTGDLERLREFYARWFEGKAGARYQNAPKGFTSYFLTFGQGAALELMSLSQGLCVRSPAGQETGYAHIAFSVGTRAQVDALTARMQAAGVPVISGPRTTGDGCYESCVLDPDGNRVEITE